MPYFLEFPDRDTLMENLAEDVAENLEQALGDSGQATLAVPGGTTPAPFLRLLSQADIDWTKVHVLLTDERFVPETSARSNTRLLRETLLQNRAAAAHLVPLYAVAEQAESVLKTLEDGIRAALPLDVCVLGMGADMHTASLFPGADNLAEALGDTDAVLLPMHAPEPRLTLTAPVLRASRHLYLLITGVEKKAALETALLEGPATEAPIRAILDAPTEVEVYYAD